MYLIFLASLLTSLNDYLIHIRYIIICFIKMLQYILQYKYLTYLLIHEHSFDVMIFHFPLPASYVIFQIHCVFSLFQEILDTDFRKDFLLKNTTSFLRVLACFPVFPHFAPSFRQTSSIPRSKFLCHFNNTHFDATIERIL